MKILIVDGQGGGIGRQLVEALKREGERDITCVGTNAIATSAMLRAGATRAATGENAAIVACREAEVIVGPIGIVVGAEGSGVSRLTKEHCDFVVSLPMNGQVNSLNASVAAGVVMYEVVRQRCLK